MINVPISSCVRLVVKVCAKCQIEDHVPSARPLENIQSIKNQFIHDSFAFNKNLYSKKETMLNSTIVNYD